MDKIIKENKDLRNKITKREFEMKDLVHTLKFYSDEKMRLEKEVEKLNRENDELIGHKNPS
jgi:predicted nuclease with TOPRIM domain